jgi:hypothetical protein
MNLIVSAECGREGVVAHVTAIEIFQLKLEKLRETKNKLFDFFSFSRRLWRRVDLWVAINVLQKRIVSIIRVDNGGSTLKKEMIPSSETLVTT